MKSCSSSCRDKVPRPQFFASLRARAKNITAQVIVAALQPANVGTGRRKPCRSKEEKLEGPDGVGDVQSVRVVGIGGFKASRPTAPEKKVVEDEDHIGHVDPRVGVAVAAQEVHRTWPWGDFPAELVGAQVHGAPARSWIAIKVVLWSALEPPHVDRRRRQWKPVVSKIDDEVGKLVGALAEGQG